MNPLHLKLLLFGLILCQGLSGQDQQVAPSQMVGSVYADDAFQIQSDGRIVTGATEIMKQLSDEQIDWNSFVEDTTIIGRKARGITYQLGTYRNTKNSLYSLRILETREGLEKVVFEFLATYDKKGNDLSAIDEQRKKWIELCNQHNAKVLIHEMYTANTIYYNHKPLIIGREALTPEYGYMNNSKYSLVLEPIIVDQVSEDYVFEIGQCKGSYGGKYILIWKKDDDGVWRIFIDSNI